MHCDTDPKEAGAFYVILCEMWDRSDETAPWSRETDAADSRQLDALAPGMLLADRFRLAEVLGAGASGQVWAALDIRVGRKVALKVLHPHLRDDASRERLRREARTATTGHPNMAAVHDLHEANGRIFLSMELVEGRSLRALLGEGQTLSIEEVVAVGRDVASALEHLHGQGFVHRDVKPGNILITPDGEAKLCDLGLSRPVTPGGTITATSMVVGTPAYMAPEQGRNTNLSPATDIYSLGLTLYRALTGTVPLEGESAVDTLLTRQKHRVESAHKHRPDCPRWLSRLIGSMLEPAPTHRPPAAGVSRALRDRHWRFISRRVSYRWAAGAVGIVGIVSAVTWLVDLREHSLPQQPVDYRISTSTSGASVDILDGENRNLGILRSSATTYYPEHLRRRGIDPVAFGDLDGDGSQEVVFADRAAPAESGVTIWRPKSGGGLEQVGAVDVRAELQYEGQLFDDFRPAHVACADLIGDGRDEIVLVQQSQPLYPTLIRVMRGDGSTITRVWHPGHLLRTFIADGDGDGRFDLFAAGSCNFIADDVGNESTPVVMRISADWTNPPPELDLFAPSRSLPRYVPEGVEIVYVNLGKVRLENYSKPWEMAYFGRIPNVHRPVRIYVTSSVIDVPSDGGHSVKQNDLRYFEFDGDLNLNDALWQTNALKALGRSPSDPALDRFLEVTYWDGEKWAPEACAVPRGPQ